jgi:hypothetical protein
MKNLNKTALLLAVLFVGLLIGCTFQESTDIRESEADFKLKQITLDDGTPCAVLVGYRKGGISCGWKQ